VFHLHHFPTNDLFTHTTYILKYMTRSYQVLEEVRICGLTASSVIKDLSKQYGWGVGGQEVEMLKK
jgi:hypothetical protein